MTLAVVVNEAAGGGRWFRRGSSLVDRLPRDVVSFVSSDARDLDEIAARIRDAKIDRLGIVGGDGTLHAVLSALATAYGGAPLPTIVPLRGGTLNTIASSLGVARGTVHANLAKLVAGRDRPIATTNRGTIACEARIGSLFGVGVTASFLAAYYESGKPSAGSAARLLSTAALESITGGPTFRSLTAKEPMAITFADGAPIPRVPTLAIAAGTIEHIGLGFAPFPRARESTTTMHLVHVHGDARDLARNLGRVRFGRPMHASVASDRLTRAFTIVADCAPIRYMLDGDLYTHESRELRVGMGPVVRYGTLGDER